MPVDVIPRVCPLSVRTGAIRTESLLDAEDEVVGSAGRMASEKSPAAVSRTREDGKKRTDVTELRWHFLATLGGAEDDVADTMYTEPSSYPVANCEPSGAMSKAAILRYYTVASAHG